MALDDVMVIVTNGTEGSGAHTIGCPEDNETDLWFTIGEHQAGYVGNAFDIHTLLWARYTETTAATQISITNHDWGGIAVAYRGIKYAAWDDLSLSETVALGTSGTMTIDATAQAGITSGMGVQLGFAYYFGTPTPTFTWPSDWTVRATYDRGTCHIQVADRMAYARTFWDSVDLGYSGGNGAVFTGFAFVILFPQFDQTVENAMPA
jgi:hypothetical protein